MPQAVFRATYRLAFWLGLVAIFLIGFGVVIAAIIGIAPPRRVHVIALGLAAILLGLSVGRNVRKVEFGPDRLWVYRLWFPRREMHYADITDVGSTTIQSRDWTFRYGGLVNHADLRKQVGIRIGMGKIPKPQPGSRLDQEDDRRWLPIAVGVFLGAVLYLLLSGAGLFEQFDGIQKTWAYFGCCFVGFVVIGVAQRLGARQ